MSMAASVSAHLIQLLSATRQRGALLAAADAAIHSAASARRMPTSRSISERRCGRPGRFRRLRGWRCDGTAAASAPSACTVSSAARDAVARAGRIAATRPHQHSDAADEFRTTRLRCARSIGRPTIVSQSEQPCLFVVPRRWLRFQQRQQPCTLLAATAASAGAHAGMVHDMVHVHAASLRAENGSAA